MKIEELASRPRCECLGCGAAHHKTGEVMFATKLLLLPRSGTEARVCASCANRRTNKTNRAARVKEMG